MILEEKLLLSNLLVIFLRDVKSDDYTAQKETDFGAPLTYKQHFINQIRT